jgi:hypothetical protein
MKEYKGEIALLSLCSTLGPRPWAPGHYKTKENNMRQQQTTQQTPDPVTEPTISMLINSIYYFIECVFILRSKNKYRLVVLQHSRVLLDRNYPTERGCRIAFARFFKNKAWDKTIKPEWSHFYDPDKDWLDEKERRLGKG